MAYLAPENPHDCTTSRLFLHYYVEESQPKPHQQRKQGEMSSAFSDASVSYYILFFKSDMVSNKLSLPIILDPRACWEWFVCVRFFLLKVLRNVQCICTILCVINHLFKKTNREGILKFLFDLPPFAPKATCLAWRKYSCYNYTFL